MDEYVPRNSVLSSLELDIDRFRKRGSSIFKAEEASNYQDIFRSVSTVSSETSVVMHLLSGSGNYEPKKAQSLINRMDKEIKRLNIENILYETYLKHIQPLSYAQTAPSLTRLFDKQSECHVRIQSTHSDIRRNHSIFSGAGSFSSENTTLSHTSKLFSPQRLTIGFRIEIVNIELQRFNRLYENSKRHYKMTKTKYTADSEEIRYSLNLLQMTRMYLENALGGDNLPMMDRRHIPAEKYIMVLKDIGHNFIHDFGKMKVISCNLVGELKKLKEKLEKFEQLGETIRPVDFEELKIDAFEISQSLETKSKYLNSLEKVTGKTSQDLAMQKRDLDLSIIRLQSLRKTLIVKEKLLEKIGEAKERTEQELDEALSENRSVINLVKNLRAPTIMHLAKTKAKQREIEKKVKFWNRHTKLQECSLNLIRKKFKTVFNAYKGKYGWLE